MYKMYCWRAEELMKMTNLVRYSPRVTDMVSAHQG